MHVGICTISNKELPVADVIDIAAELEVDGIEPWGRDHVDGSLDRAREIKDRAAAADLEVPVYGSYLRPGDESFADAYDHELALAEALDADLIRVWAGNEEYQDVSDHHWNAVVADLETLADAAEAAGVAITVERHSGTVTNTRAGAARLIEETPANVGLNWQAGRAPDSATVLEDARELAPLSNNVHVQTAAAPDAGERCPLAYSYVDLERVIDAFAAAGFDGYLEIEFVTQRCSYDAAVAADVAFLRRVLA